MRCPAPPRRGGFTLVELLVALVAFAILATMAWGGLAHLLNTRAALERQGERLATINTVFLLIHQDLLHALARPVKGAGGITEPPFSGMGYDGALFTLTRAVDRGPMALGAPLQRVSYQWREGRLWRRWWQHADATGDREPRESPLPLALDGVTVRFLDHDGVWQSQWLLPWQPDSPPGDRLPRGLEVTLELPGWGGLTRLFPVAGG